MTSLLSPQIPSAAMQSDCGIDYDPEHTRQVRQKSRRNGNRPKNTNAIVSGGYSDSSVPSRRQTKQRAASAVTGSRSNALQNSTPAKPASYAGATFSASPAPATLPMPRFLAKSVPPADTALLGSDTPVPVRRKDFSLAPPQSQGVFGSPLDILFNADRREKAQVQLQAEQNTPSRTPAWPMPDSGQSGSPSPSRGVPTINRSFTTPNKDLVDKSIAQQRLDEQTKSLKSFLNIANNNSGQSQSTINPSVTPRMGQRPYSQNSPPQTEPLYYGSKNLSPLFGAVRDPTSLNSIAQSSPTPQQAGLFSNAQLNQFPPTSSRFPPPQTRQSPFYSGTTQDFNHAPQPFLQQCYQSNPAAAASPPPQFNTVANDSNRPVYENRSQQINNAIPPRMN